MSGPDFFICGPVYTDRKKGQPVGVHVEFTAYMITKVPGTDEPVAFGFRCWDDSRDERPRERVWRPDFRGPDDFPRFTIKKETGEK